MRTQQVILATMMCMGALGVALQANAFAPTDDVHIGQEPVRVYRYHSQVQARLMRTPDWQEFTATEGQNWRGRFDERTGAIRSMRGGNIAINTTSSDTVNSDFAAFIGRHGRLLGVDLAGLVPRAAGYIEHTDTWYLHFDQWVDGAPVWRGGVQAVVKQGNLILVTANGYATTDTVGRLNLSMAQALDVAMRDGPVPSAEHSNAQAELVWLPVDSSNEVRLVRAWMTRTDTHSPIGEWVSFVDAHSGELLNVHNEVRFASGHVNVSHHERNPNSSLVLSGAPDVLVETDGDVDYTDDDGYFSVAGTGSYSADLDGRYLKVKDAAQSYQVEDFSWSSGDLTISASNTSQTEADVYTFVHHVRDWGKKYASEVGMTSRKLTANVSMTDAPCNAYYNGEINMQAKNGTCNDTGQIADVVYHEWGHGFHYYSIESGSYDGSVGEGAGDVIAVLQTGDHLMAPYFRTNGAYIRNLSPDRVYPDDVQGQVHADGLIFGGAFWDLWNALDDDLGAQEGFDATSEIFVGTLKFGPSLESSWDAAIAADDDNGDLTDGTPHFCALLDTFGRHGLGPGGVGGGAAVIIDHEPLDVDDSEQDIPVEVSLINLAPECADFTAGEALLFYRADGGSWKQVDATVDGDSVAGAIPAQPFGTFVEYYMQVDADGAAITAPTGGPVNPFPLYAGGVLPIDCDDFEGDDGGYTHELISGGTSSGADDWQWGEPMGLAGDPDYAHSGNNVWGNDLGGVVDGQQYNGQYQRDVHNRITSRAFEPAHYEDVFLHYWRWLQVEDGFYDQGSILANGEQVWSNYNSQDQNGGAHHQEAQWVPHSVDLGDLANTSSLSFSWEIVSDRGVHMGGWNIDDVCIYAPATANNRLAILDFQASDGESGAVSLTWTNPIWAPLAEVVVVRKEGGWPTGPTDGVVVFESSSVGLGAAMQADDTTGVDGVEYHYAVYGGDGAEWLGWTNESRNADMGSGFDLPGVPDDTLDVNGGCACSSAPTTPAMLWMLVSLGGLLTLRRRRA